MTKERAGEICFKIIEREFMRGPSGAHRDDVAETDRQGARLHACVARDVQQVVPHASGVHVRVFPPKLVSAPLPLAGQGQNKNRFLTPEPTRAQHPHGSCARSLYPLSYFLIRF